MIPPNKIERKNKISKKLKESPLSIETMDINEN